MPSLLFLSPADLTAEVMAELKMSFGVWLFSLLLFTLASLNFFQVLE